MRLKGEQKMSENEKKEVTEQAADQPAEKKKGKGKIIGLVILVVIVAVGGFFGIRFINDSVNYLITDNARVTTELVRISPNIPGVLERFTVYVGRYVSENEILGWVENDSAMRAPFDGLVVDASAVQGQSVSPMESLAVLADTGRIHISANIEETDILKLRTGQAAVVTIDGLGTRQFNGYISDIGLVTHAELTGQAMFFNTGGTFTRVTHLIPIEITITDDVNLDSLIGVNARVRIPLR